MNITKLDILAFAAHPDDVELSCSGTLLLHADLGKKTGVIDFTQGELGTNGSPELRLKEAQASSQILGLHIRRNLELEDGFFKNTKKSKLKIITAIRQYQPDIVLINAPQDRHPDHGKAAQLALESCFLSGLKRIETFDDAGKPQLAWRPRNVYHYIQSMYIEPDFVVDITPYWDKKIESIYAFSSQFYNPHQAQGIEKTFISTPDFADFLKARAIEMGHIAGVKYAEGFIKTRRLAIRNLFDLV